MEKRTEIELFSIISQLANWLSFILPIVAVLLIVLATRNYLTAHGNREIVSAGNKKMIYAAITIVIMIIARFYLSIINSIDPI